MMWDACASGVRVKLGLFDVIYVFAPLARWPRWRKKRWIITLLNAVHSCVHLTARDTHRMSIQFHSISGHQQIVFHSLVYPCPKSGQPCQLQGQCTGERMEKFNEITEEPERIGIFQNGIPSIALKCWAMCARDHRRQLKVIFIFPSTAAHRHKVMATATAKANEQQEKMSAKAHRIDCSICNAFRNVRNGLLREPRWGSEEGMEQRKREAMTMERE